MSRKYQSGSERLERNLLGLILLLGCCSACTSGTHAGENAGTQLPVTDLSRQSESIRPQRLPSTYAGDDNPDKLTNGESRQILVLESFTNAWIFCFGGAVGSFLNVVAYRMPMGMSLIHPPSRCSGCNTKIEFRDNLPMIGWLALRGRCRHCRIPISMRYPLVETVTALLFLIVAHVELLSGGASLPIRNPNTYTGVVWILWYSKWDLIGIYLYHMLLISGLLALSLMIQDNARVPGKFQISMALLGIVLPTVFPNLHPLPWSLSLWNTYGGSAWDIPIWWAFFSPILGGAIGWGVGRSVERFLFCVTSRMNIHNGIRISFLLIGIFLGWQAAVWTGILSTVLASLAVRFIRSEMLSRCISSWMIFTSSCAYLLAWRWWPTLSI